MVLQIPINEAFTALSAITKLRKLATDTRGCIVYFNFTILPPSVSTYTSHTHTRVCTMLGYFCRKECAVNMCCACVMCTCISVCVEMIILILIHKFDVCHLSMFVTCKDIMNAYVHVYVYMCSLYFVICRIYPTCQIKVQIFNRWNDFTCEIMYAH